jgi:hypothetical protein
VSKPCGKSWGEFQHASTSCRLAHLIVGGVGFRQPDICGDTAYKQIGALTDQTPMPLAPIKAMC